jgi:uncharacterized protein YacL
MFKAIMAIILLFPGISYAFENGEAIKMGISATVVKIANADYNEETKEISVETDGMFYTIREVTEIIDGREVKFLITEF